MEIHPDAVADGCNKPSTVKAKSKFKTKAVAKAKAKDDSKKRSSDTTTTEVPTKKLGSSSRKPGKIKGRHLPASPPDANDQDSDVPDPTTTKSMTSKKGGKKTANNVKSKEDKTSPVDTDVDVTKKSAKKVTAKACQKDS